MSSTTNEAMREALREIENRAAAALHNQPEDTEQNARHLNKSLAGIEFRAHTARLPEDCELPRLEYAGSGQIIDAQTRRLVSPRLVVKYYLRLRAVATIAHTARPAR